jgi:hypothetical protein
MVLIFVLKRIIIILFKLVLRKKADNQVKNFSTSPFMRVQYSEQSYTPGYFF